MDRAGVDSFFDAAKTVAIVDDWRLEPGHPSRHFRTMALEISGAVVAQLILVALSHLGEEKAKAYITWPEPGAQIQIARLEMGNQAIRHANAPPQPHGLPPWVGCPHAHLWRDNRHLVKDGRSFPGLGYARPIPGGSMGWEEVVRWFLVECKIAAPETLLFGIPRRMTLL